MLPRDAGRLHHLAIGRWQLDRAKGVVHVIAFEALTRPTRTAIEAEVADIARFLAQELAIG